MQEKYGAQVEETLEILETKVERAYDISIQKEIEQLTKEIKEMSLNIHELVYQNVEGRVREILSKIIEQVNNEAESLIKHLVKLSRKQEKQEAMYNVSHLYSKILDELIDELEEIKEKCVAQARRCVNDIDSIFDEVKTFYQKELSKLELEQHEEIIDKVNYEITKCRNVVHDIHSQYTYKIEQQIVANLDKMASNLTKIKGKNIEDNKHIRIKGGVTNLQNGKYSLSSIIESKTEVITDIPTRANIQDLFD